MFDVVMMETEMELHEIRHESLRRWRVLVRALNYVQPILLCETENTHHLTLQPHLDINAELDIHCSELSNIGVSICRSINCIMADDWRRSITFSDRLSITSKMYIGVET